MSELYRFFLQRAARILVPFALIFSPNLEAAPNTLTRASTLYANGHPTTGEAGQVLSIAVTDSGLLFASFAGFSNPESTPAKQLHVWNIQNPASPILISSLDFSDPAPRGAPLDPTFLAPNDLLVVGNHLFFWRNFELYSYRIEKNGLLTQIFRSDFADDLNPDLNRPVYGGYYASTERQLLTNNEFLNLIDVVGYDVAEDLISENTLINLQDPTTPFNVKQNQTAGKNLRIFDPPPNGSYRGLPARIDLTENSLSLTYLEQTKDAHLSSFWASALRSTFVRKNLRRTLKELSRAIAESVSSSKLVRDINTRMRNGLALPDVSLSARIGLLYEQEATLASLLAQFDISPDDSIELALEKAVNSLYTAELQEVLSNQIVKNLLNEWMRTLFGRIPKFGRSLAASINGAFQGRKKSLGLDRYLVEVVMGPLIDSSPLFRVRLRSVINAIADSNAGQLVTATLETFNTILPARQLLKSAGFKFPKCFNIPANARQFLALLLTTRGAKLDPDNYAFIELLKLYAHYSGSSNYSRLIRSIGKQLDSLHQTVANNLSLSFFQGLDLGVELNEKTSTILSRVQAGVDVRAVVTRAIVANILTVAAADGITGTHTVREALEDRGLYIEVERVPFGASLSTTAQFTTTLGSLVTGATSITSLTTISAQAQVTAQTNGRDLIRSSLERVVISLFTRIFGESSLELTLEESLFALISQRLTPANIGNFVQSLIGEALLSMKNSVPLPSLVENGRRAAQGDCIAQYQIALLAISAVPVVGELALAAEVALSEAQDYALDFVLERMLNAFFSAILQAADGDYASWDLRLTTGTLQVPLDALTNRNARFVSPFILAGKVVLAQRDISQNGWIPGDSRTIDIAIADPGNIDSTLETIASTGWDQVRSIIADERGYLTITGARLGLNDFPESAVVIVNLLDATQPRLELQGELAQDLSTVSELVSAPTSELFAIRTTGGGVTLLTNAVQ